MSPPSKKALGVAILAAGEGRRLLHPSPKPLVPLAGKSLIDYPLDAVVSFLARENISGKTAVVIGHAREAVRSHLQSRFESIDFAIQQQQRGTGDALKAYFSLPWACEQDFTLVMGADTPLFTSHDLSPLWSAMMTEDLDGVVATFKTKNPTGLGRILRGRGPSIVEEKEATLEQKSLCEVNSGVYLFKTSFLKDSLGTLKDNNNAREFYVTDLFQGGPRVRALLSPHKKRFLGVNTLKELEKAGSILRKRAIATLREKGVHFIHAKSCFVDSTVRIGRGTMIHPQCHVLGRTTIGEDCVLEPGAILKDCTLGDSVVIRAHSNLEKSEVQRGACIGPFARLRSGTTLGEGSKLGNFVETKKTTIGKHSSVSHLSYLGDAIVGDHTNIGCGFVTCNYDGEKKHKTKIGPFVFIGSHTQVVAPISIGEGAYIACGATLTKDVPPHSFAISRSGQINREGEAKRFHKGKWKEQKASS